MFGSNTRKTFNRFTTSDSYTWNITHNKESTAVCNSKPEPSGSLLVEEAQYQEENSCHKNNERVVIYLQNMLQGIYPFGEIM
jgi:hypothetical protein